MAFCSRDVPDSFLGVTRYQIHVTEQWKDKLSVGVKGYHKVPRMKPGPEHI